MIFMKMKNLIKIAAVLAVIASFAVAPAQAITAKEAKELKTTILSVPVPEMPAKAADLVKRADKPNREAVAVTLVKTVVFKHRAAAPLMISAISKASPEVAPAISAAAAEISSDQAVSIARAATIAAPGQAQEISSKVGQAAPAQRAFVAAGVTAASQPAVFITRGAAAGPADNGNTSVSTNPVDYAHGFPNQQPGHPSGTPTAVTTRH